MKLKNIFLSLLVSAAFTNIYAAQTDTSEPLCYLPSHTDYFLESTCDPCAPCRPCGSICDCFSFFGEVESGYKRMRMPAYSYGNLTDSATFTQLFGVFPETSTSQDETSNAFTAAFAGFDFLKCFTIEASANFTADVFSRHIPDFVMSPADLAAIFVTIAPLLNNTIVVQGSGPTIIEFHRSYNYSQGALALFWNTPFGWQPINSLQWAPYIEGSMEKLTQKYGVHVETITPDAIVFLEENLDTNYYNLGGGLDLSCPLFSSPFSFLFGGGVFWSHAHTLFKGFQNLNIVILRSLREEKFTDSWKVKSLAGFSFQTSTIAISLVGRYEYWGYIPRVVNVEVPNLAFQPNLSSRMGNTYSWNYSIGLNFSYGF